MAAASWKNQIEPEFCSFCHEKFGTHEPRIREEKEAFHLDCARYKDKVKGGE